MRRWSRCEDRCAFGARERGCSLMALRLRRLQDRRRLGAVALAFNGVEAIVLRRLSLCVVRALGGGDNAFGAYDDSEEAVAWTTARRRLLLDAVVRQLGGGCRRLGRRLVGGCCLMLLYDGLEEAVAWTTAWRRLSLDAVVRRLGGDCCLDDGSVEAVAWLGVALAFTRGTVNQL
jgi:hypothetical protein